MGLDFVISGYLHSCIQEFNWGLGWRAFAQHSVETEELNAFLITTSRGQHAETHSVSYARLKYQRGLISSAQGIDSCAPSCSIVLAAALQPCPTAFLISHVSWCFCLTYSRA
jgi:hypothetical protein